MKQLMAVISAALLVWSCSNGTSSTQSVPAVMTTSPVVTNADMVKHLSGEIKESSQTSVGFKAAGQIMKIYVKEGDHVTEGQLLAQLDDKDYKLGVEAIEPQYNQLKDEVARYEKLYESQAMSGNDYEKAKTGLEQLRVQLQVNKNKLEYTKLYAPKSGTIQSVNFETMEMVDAGTPVFTLLDTKHMEVEVNIPSSIYLMQSRIRSYVGHVNIDGGIDIPLKTSTITPKADASQLYKMTLLIEGTPDRRLTAGMNVDVLVGIDGGREGDSASYTLPLKSVFQDGGVSKVWVVNEDSTVSSREVTMDGVADNGDVIISSGLTGTETIVKAGVTHIHEGDKVRIVDQPADTNVGGLI